MNALLVPAKVLCSSEAGYAALNYAGHPLVSKSMTPTSVSANVSRGSTIDMLTVQDPSM